MIGYEQGAVATDQGGCSYLSAHRWIIKNNSSYLLTITLKKIAPTFPGVMIFFIWHLTNALRRLSDVYQGDPLRVFLANEKEKAFGK